MIPAQVDVQKARPILSEAVINAHIGQRIRLGREALGMRQLDLAARIGVGHRTVSKYESGTVLLNVEMLWRIAKALNKSPDYFYEGLRPPAPITVQ